jgi:hypothetical protein
VALHSVIQAAQALPPLETHDYDFRRHVDTSGLGCQNPSNVYSPSRVWLATDSDICRHLLQLSKSQLVSCNILVHRRSSRRPLRLFRFHPNMYGGSLEKFLCPASFRMGMVHGSKQCYQVVKKFRSRTVNLSRWICGWTILRTVPWVPVLGHPCNPLISSNLLHRRLVSFYPPI